MKQNELKELLIKVQNNSITIDDAVLALKKEPFKDIDFAKIDTHRGIRQGMAEVIYGAGKTKEQIACIVHEMMNNNTGTILITRLSEDAAEYLRQSVDLFYDSLSKVCIIGDIPK